MVRGDPAEQERTVTRAIEIGVNYFDTAPQYGDGASERNLGRVLARLKPDVLVGTKVRLRDEERGGGAVAGAVRDRLDASLQRLGLDHVDILHLHNPITLGVEAGTVNPETMLGEVVPAFEEARKSGKTRFLGITAVGETEALHRVVAAGAFDTAQVCYNLLNPSAGNEVKPRESVQDYGNLLARMQAVGMGAIGIRALAGGALSGEAGRHPVASPPPEPIGSGPDYAADLARARGLLRLAKELGAESLAELALRFAISQPGLAMTLIGIASTEQFEAAATAAQKGTLEPDALRRIEAAL
jgi:L-galactose dehydrogenase/L-glyceraldehyde 3-phosphate reductase